MMKYIGDGFMPGIPARDLSDDEVKQFGERRLLATGLYKKVRIYRRPIVAEEVTHGTRDQEPSPDSA